MTLTILSETPPQIESGFLPLALSDGAAPVPAEIRLRSGSDVAYGVFDLAPGFTASVSAREHLFVLATSGLLEVSFGASRIHLSAGEAMVMPQGAHAAWSSETGASALFSSCADPAAASDAGIVALRLDAEREVSPPYPQAMLLAGEPRQSGRRAFADSTGRWTVGMWDSQPYHRKPIAFPKNELMYLHSGSVSFTRPDASVLRHDRNGAFLVTKGFQADWNSQVYVFKTFCADTM